MPDALAPIYTGGRGGLEACLMNTYNLPPRPLYTLAESQDRRPRALMQLDLDREREDDGARLMRYKVTTYRAHEQRARVHFLDNRFAPDTDVTRSVSDFDSHVYLPARAGAALPAGFTVAAWFGDYDGSPLLAGSSFIIAVGRKPEA